MKNTYYTIGLLLISWTSLAQTVNFNYFDAQTGKAIQPNSLKFENENQSYKISESEISSEKLLKRRIKDGEYNVSIEAKGYQTIESHIQINSDIPVQHSFYLRNQNPPQNIRVDYIQSLHRPDGAVVVGYIVDENGHAVTNAEIISNDGEKTKTNVDGYFNLFLKLPDLQTGFSIKSLEIHKQNFKTDRRENIVVYPNGDYIFKVILTRGTGIKTTSMSDIIVENGIITGRQKDKSQPYFESIEVDKKSKKSFNCTDIPNSITVGYTSLNDTESNCVFNCPFKVTVDFETYVSESLDNEWLSLWSTLPDIENAYRAGAVAIRSFAGWRAVVAPRTSTYDITNNTNDQAYSPGTTSWALAAQLATEGSVLKSSSTGNFISTNYAAETNNWQTGPCANGYVQNSVGANQCIEDVITFGYPQLGHPWNMGQWQSARWATGLDLAHNYFANVGSPHGLGNKSWQWIVDHYYPSHSLFNCDNPVNNNLDCTNAVTLSCGVTYSAPNSTATSAVDSYGCNNWTESGPERVHVITPQGDGTLTATLSNFTGDLDVYILGSCNPFDCLGTVSSSSATFTNAIKGQSYYIVVDADDGSGSGYDLIVSCPPPTGLDCSNAVSLSCGSNYFAPSSNASSQVEIYGCNNWTESGPERVHKVTPTISGPLTASLSNFIGDLDVYILGSCNPSDCIGTVNSQSATLTNAIAGQTYYIVVDADDGSGSSYDLFIDCPVGLVCTNAVTLSCGSNYFGPSSSAASQVDSYGCNNWTETGPERVHKITPQASGLLTATLSNFTGDLDVYILGSCDPDDCLGTVSASSASFNNAVAGTSYYIVVDADDGSGSSYNLIVDCPPVGLDCNAAVSLSCGVNYFGPSSTNASLVDAYGCNNWTETGPERLHKITPQANGTLTATLSNFKGDLDVYILGSCDPDDCLGTVLSSSANYTNAVAGTTYYIVVDADDGSGSSYNLLVDCPMQPNDCPPILSLNMPVMSGTYEASIQVNASTTLMGGSSVQFKGGNNVLLNGGFSVPTGAAFEAVIENCNN